MSTRDDYPVTRHLTDIAENRYNRMADEIDRLRAKVDHYAGWFGTECRCDEDDGPCPLDA